MLWSWHLASYARAGCVVALLAGCPPYRRLMECGLSRWLVRETITGVVATIVTAPLIAWTFGRVSVVAPVMARMVVPEVMPVPETTMPGSRPAVLATVT
jgi:hypothetical protein